MTGVWKTRMYQEGDETGIISLIDLVLPNSDFDIRRWLWKYENNPYGFLSVVAEHNRKIVGHMGLILVDVKVGHKIMRGSQACDLCVHPDFRRQGMFLAMGKTLMKTALDEKVLLAFGFPNEPAYHGHLRYGWFDVSRMPVLATYFDTCKFITAEYGKLAGIEPLAKQLSRFVDYFFYRKRQHAFSSIQDLRFTEVSCFDKRINEFWNRVSKNYGKIVVRNRKYLNWRYFHRPDRDYNAFLAEKANQIEGYLVLSTEKTGRRKIGYIVDVLSTSKDVFLDLIHASVEYFSSQSVDSIICWMLEGSVWYKALEESGFISYFQPKGRFIARINSYQLFQPYKMAREWYVTAGDSDHV